MTAIGKLLVFLNLFAAVALVTWATSLTANRLDWVDRKDADGQSVEGEITKLKKRIDATVKSVGETSSNYGQQEKALADAESGNDPGREGRDKRRAVFAERIEAARKGSFAEQRQIPGKVLIDVQAQGDPIKGPNGQPLEGVDVYQGRLDNYLKDSRTAIEQINELRTRFGDLSIEVKTTDDRIAAQRLIRKNLLDEAKFLEGVQINWDEELRTLKTRRGQLERRIQSVSRQAPAAGSAGGL